MTARTRGRLMPLVVVPLLVVLAAFVAGLVFPAHNHQHVAVIDVRQSRRRARTSRSSPESCP
ncbi:hypothetical protein LWP59_27755 [Amycolatopsis acidiphila]|uniref:Uncharacterized protein n=1 Tax=Amycolatopsis acidiphila TaxID=715473 RepID=A0A557ZWR8_9PSEU|nr:hypothetical protein [Amycolatopsis acidiphila]TVT16456.1 hypothetical protein FNH06_34675 [Amycolatopsis acidiphila]UIJ57909.1 hypothetical protein LWP59_27755 [Amycolatopsis acidiphila]